MLIGLIEENTSKGNQEKRRRKLTSPSSDVLGHTDMISPKVDTATLFKWSLKKMS